MARRACPSESGEYHVGVLPLFWFALFAAEPLVEHYSPCHSGAEVTSQSWDKGERGARFESTWEMREGRCLWRRKTSHNGRAAVVDTGVVPVIAGQLHLRPCGKAQVECPALQEPIRRGATNAKQRLLLTITSTDSVVVTPAGVFPDCLVVRQRGPLDAFPESFFVYARGVGEVLTYTPASTLDEATLARPDASRTEAVRVASSKLARRAAMRPDPNGFSVLLSRFSVIAAGSKVTLFVERPAKEATAVLMLCEHGTCNTAEQLTDARVDRQGTRQLAVSATGSHYLVIKDRDSKLVPIAGTHGDSIRFENGLQLRAVVDSSKP